MQPDTLPEHHIRFSSRAKRVLLRVVYGKGLEVVLPESAAKGLPPSFIPDLLRRNKAWIDRTLARVALCEKEKEAERAFPEGLLLHGGKERVAVQKEDWPANRTPRPRLREYPLQAGTDAADNFGASRLLRLTGGSEADYLRLVRQWLKDEAAKYFTPRITELSHKHDLPFSCLTFRFQKSRWGSCSARGSINLNVSLLFLSEELADYILLHELCHTRHLNHSESYWKLVFSCDSRALEKDTALRRAKRFVPAWVKY